MLLVVCASVLLFAFHAKTGIYDHGFQVKPDASVSSKLWLYGQRIRTITAPLIFLFLAQIFYRFSLFLDQAPLNSYRAPIAEQLRFLAQHRYERPPPTI
jgi:hypothetical protein